MPRIVNFKYASLAAALAASLFPITGCGGNSDSALTESGSPSVLQAAQKAENISPAVRVLMEKCDKKDAEACHKVAVAYREGEGVGLSTEKDHLYSLKSCDLGFGKACYNIGEDYFNGMWVKKDLTRARIYHEKACTFGNAVGCISAGFAYLEGREVRKSPEKALKYFNKAAELGEPAAAAGAIATVILTERWTNRYSEVFQLLEKSCQLDCARSCLILGNLYTTGRLVSPDKQKARNFWQKACDLSDAQACEKYNQ